MTQLEKSVLASGFVAMTEDELYEVNGGRILRNDPSERPSAWREGTRYERPSRPESKETKTETRTNEVHWEVKTTITPEPPFIKIEATSGGSNSTTTTITTSK